MFERLISKVCSLKVPLAVTGAGGSFLTSRSREDTKCFPVCGMEQWEGRRKGGEAQAQGKVDLGSASRSLNADRCTKDAGFGK